MKLYVAQRKDGKYWTHGTPSWIKDVSGAWPYEFAYMAERDGCKAMRVYLTTRKPRGGK